MAIVVMMVRWLKKIIIGRQVDRGNDEDTNTGNVRIVRLKPILMMASSRWLKEMVIIKRSE